MNGGKVWLRISVLVAIGFGFLGAGLLRATDVLPSGWGWYMAAYLASAVVGWLAFAAIVTLAGR